MDNVTIQANTAISRYFHILSTFGFINQVKTNKLILLLYLEDILTNYSENITEDDYRVIGNALNCLTGSNCLIPYPEYINEANAEAQIGNIIHT